MCRNGVFVDALRRVDGRAVEYILRRSRVLRSVEGWYLEF
jgi:hypothetical protein